MTRNEPVIESHAVEPFLKNGYLLACPVTKQGAYIDPGDEADLVLDRIDELGLRLQAIIATHAHLDHICGIGRVREKWPVPIFLHPEDLRIYERLPNQAEWFGLQCDPAPSVTHRLSESETLRIGDLELKFHHTPGHSPGHVVVEVGDYIFCGDTVFAGSIGRTDLPGGDYDTLIRSISEKIFPLGDEKVLLPGHGPRTSVLRERTTNPFLTSAAGRF